METLQSAEETLPKNTESIELKDLSGVVDTTSQSVEDVETALKTINDPQIDVAWVAQTRRELAGVWEAMTRSRDELANNLAKLSAIDDRRSEGLIACGLAYLLRFVDSGLWPIAASDPAITILLL